MGGKKKVAEVGGGVFRQNRSEVGKYEREILENSSSEGRRR